LFLSSSDAALLAAIALASISDNSFSFSLFISLVEAFN
jgi:hypothetical protein